MAFNVYLTFFHKYDAAKLRYLEWKYMVFCYGLPFIPPFAYLFISSSSKGPVYGSATVSLPHLPPFWVDQLTVELVMVLGCRGLGYTPYRRLLRASLVRDFAHVCHLCSCRH
jgi:hypothetical protein